MLTEEEKKNIVEKILQSKDFKDSPIYTNLLSYLVDSTLSENIPKEITIAIDVFRKDSSFNSNKDTTVRYHVHMLRKKLEKYYRNEDKDDKIRLVIPKGHYEIKFMSSKDSTSQKFNQIISFLKRWEIATILLLILFSSYILYRYFYLISTSRNSFEFSTINPNDKIWDSFFENGYPITVILGDDYLLDEYNSELNRYRQIRDWDIDSQSDLNNFLIQYPKQNLWKSEITGIPFGGAINLMDILPILYQIHDDISLKMSSLLTLEEIRNHNIIYIGEFKNLRILNKIIYKLPIRFQYQPDERLFFIDSEGDTVKTFLRIEAPYYQTNKYNVDYSLLIKIPGFTNEIFMFIVGFGYGGRLERSKMLANSEQRAEFVAEIKKINSHVPEYFIALFEVKSIERTGFTNELKYFKEISRDFFNK